MSAIRRIASAGVVFTALSGVICPSISAAAGDTCGYTVIVPGAPVYAEPDHSSTLLKTKDLGDVVTGTCITQPNSDEPALYTEVNCTCDPWDGAAWMPTQTLAPVVLP